MRSCCDASLSVAKFAYGTWAGCWVVLVSDIMGDRVQIVSGMDAHTGISFLAFCRLLSQLQCLFWNGCRLVGLFVREFF